MTEDKYRWETEFYKVLQAFPCENLLAVYAECDDEHPGFYTLKSYPVHFLAVAKVTTRFYERKAINDIAGFQQYDEPYIQNEIVGLQLSEGYWSVCNELGGFAGLCHAGEDITAATGCLDKSKYPLHEKVDVDE